MPAKKKPSRSSLSRSFARIKQKQDLTETRRRFHKLGEHMITPALLAKVNPIKLAEMLKDARLARRSVLANLKEARKIGTPEQVLGFKGALVDMDNSIKQIKRFLQEHKLKEN